MVRRVSQKEGMCCSMMMTVVVEVMLAARTMVRGDDDIGVQRWKTKRVQVGKPETAAAARALRFWVEM